ncbi:MAG: metal/formaldehyde-sensitive transcriptional repressor [Stagnimonas sp.]|nr:metal/formaldehyde-sensitive transcriptional repressor [Stagnimonas sp.]
MAHTIENKKPLLNRVRRMQGQLGSLEKSLEEGGECGAVLQQIAAIRGAVNGLMNEVLEGHLRTHLVPANGGGPEELEDLVRVIRSYMK